MDKDFEELTKSMDKVLESLKAISKDFDKLVKEATGKTLDEIMAMPVETVEERKAFVEELMKVKDAMNGEKVHNFDGQYIKISGGEHCTSFEAKGSKEDLIHMLAQGVCAMINNLGIKDDKVDEFIKIFTEEVKSMLKNGIMI